GIELTASGETTHDFSTSGINYKGRIQYNNATNASSFVFTNSSATASVVLTDSTTANTIICNSFEPTTVNTDMIIKANTAFIWRYHHTYIIIRCCISFLQSSYLLIKTYGLSTALNQNMIMKLAFFTLTCIVSKTGNGYINGNFDCGGLIIAPDLYNNTQVDNLMSGKQSARIFRDPT
ncbi:MAG: hypothetical protein ACKPKO_57475, partial [Candidatus Fonsibacter sp.]